MARSALSDPPHERFGPKTGAALLSIASNTLLIVVKVIAGVVTGSVAILTEAMHSAIDLSASVVAYFSLRKADEPADESHPYGHEKIENLAAAIEGMLILVGSCVISRRAQRYDSPALEGDAAHLRTDAATSMAVLIGLVLVQVTGEAWLDAAVALLVAGAIVVTGVRILSRSTRALVDEALPEDELRAIRETVTSFGPRGVAGYHRLRARRAGSRRHVDLHVQFRSGTSLEEAHHTAHELQDAIARRLDRADILIHLEPEDRVEPGTEIPM